MADATHDPGGKVLLPLPPGVIGSAVYGGEKDCYRYLAEYHLETFLEEPRTLMVVGMNPSTARADCFDPTIAKLWRCGRRWGFNYLLMTNGHAYRATDQDRLLEVEDAVGPDNNLYLLGSAARADMILMAYGTPKRRQLRERGVAMARMLLAAGHKLHALRLSKNNIPWHPLYIGDAVEPQPWEGPHA